MGCLSTFEQGKVISFNNVTYQNQNNTNKNQKVPIQYQYIKIKNVLMNYL